MRARLIDGAVTIVVKNVWLMMLEKFVRKFE